MKNFNCPVVEEIANHELCVGCGFCAGICPSNVLQMIANRKGEIVPILKGECSKCRICMKICPFGNRKHYLPILASNQGLLGSDSGISCWGGDIIDKNALQKRSSGGILTELLCHLHQKEMINGAVVIGNNLANRKPFFVAQLAENQQAIVDAAGSKYCPVHYTEVIKQLIIFPGKVAFVGLPCHCTAMRNAMKINSKLREKVRFVFGLTCGHQVTTAFTEFLATIAGIPLDNIEEITYRKKVTNRSANNFAFYIKHAGKDKKCLLHFRESAFGKAWRRRLFTINACDFCADVFAEQADATFMDAWIAPFQNEPGGTSLIVTRNKESQQALVSLSDTQQANIWQMSADDIRRSQEGIIKYKRTLLPARIYATLAKGGVVPERLKSFGKKGSWRQNVQLRRYKRNNQFARIIWDWRWPSAKFRAKLILLFTSPMGSVTFRSYLKKMMP